MTSAAPTRSRLSEEFVGAHRRARLLQGFAKAVAEQGYLETSVTDIVRSTRCARNTFYETFGSKAEAGLALLAEVCPELGERYAGVDLKESSVALVAVDTAALWWAGSESEALQVVAAGDGLARLLQLEVEIRPGEHPELSTLPPGRHGLPRKFVLANQRSRLLCGTATAIADHSFIGATISDVCECANVSRRTFYEHFDSKVAAAEAMVQEASSEAATWLASIGTRSALRIVATEVVATRLAAVTSIAAKKASEARDVLDQMGERFREEGDR